MKSKQPTTDHSKLFITVIISILLIIVGSTWLVYFWQKSSDEKRITALKEKVSSLEKQISSIKKDEKLPNPTSPVANPTLNWRTYSNQDLGFSFKYPSNWSKAETNLLSTRMVITIKDGNEEIDDSLPARLEITSGVYYNQSLQREMNLDELINFFDFSTEEALTSGKISLGNWLGKRFTYHVHGIGYFTTDVFLARPDNPTKILHISYRHSDDPEEYKSKLPKTLSQILSTFKVIN